MNNQYYPLRLQTPLLGFKHSLAWYYLRISSPLMSKDPRRPKRVIWFYRAPSWEKRRNKAKQMCTVQGKDEQTMRQIWCFGFRASYGGLCARMTFRANEETDIQTKKYSRICCNERMLLRITLLQTVFINKSKMLQRIKMPQRTRRNIPRPIFFGLVILILLKKNLFELTLILE